MTNQEIDPMPAGIEIDTLVAERVMGYSGRPSNYSEDIAAAWEVVEKMRMDFKFLIGDEGEASIDKRRICCDLSALSKKGLSGNARAETAPLAICRAALKTVQDRE
jgi:hypothetical protein